jgi:hypothetical protein
MHVEFGFHTIDHNLVLMASYNTMNNTRWFHCFVSFNSILEIDLGSFLIFLILVHPLQRTLSIPTHVFASYVQINHFCDFRYNIDSLLWHLVKMISSRINDYKVVYSCICNLYLWLMSIWMKMKMKNTFILSFLVASLNRWKCSCFFQLGRWFKGHWILCGIFSTWFVTINFSHKCHIIKCEKNELANEIVGFNGLIVSLNFVQWINH